MAYRILTYTDPYELNKTPFWNEIRNFPHFCVARTLVNGLVDIMQDSIGGLICPLDDLLKREEIYKDWEDNISRRIAQFSYLTDLFEKTKERSTDPKKEAFFESLNKNKSDFLDAIRLFQELGISADSLHPELALKEQRAFIRVLGRIQQDKVALFQFPSIDKQGKKLDIDAAVRGLAEKEVEDYRKQCLEGGRDIDQRRLSWLNSIKEKTQKTKVTGIIVHGVHQFSPTQIRLLTDLEKQGITIYFLFNYQPKYASIYDSWLNIYSNFDVQPETDGKECAIVPPEQQTQSYALATALGLLCEGHYSPANPSMRCSYDHYKSCKFVEFENLTEYAHYVSDIVDKAKKQYWNSSSAVARGAGQNSSAKILAMVDEQVYTANRDIHDLLNVYYPEYSKERHFLSFPVGQFFAGLYQLWDWETGSIKFDLPIVRECISSGLLNKNLAPTMLRVTYDLEVILERIETYTGDSNSFESVMETYLKRYTEVTNSVPQSLAYAARRLSIYSESVIKKEEIVQFINTIRDLNACGVELFGQSHENRIEFQHHFGNLEKFIRDKKPELVTEAEKELVNDLLGRFESVKTTTASINGTFEDLKQGLYYYLRQKKDENRVDWIVKNFEQIDGDILQSKGQHRSHIRKLENGETGHKEKIYHFGALSDRDMNVSIDKLLPWPLTDEFILKAYSPVDLQFQVYYSALSERSNFLRYALFYGLYYNRCDVKLSYVKQIQDDITEPYTLLTILGLEPKPIKLAHQNHEIWGGFSTYTLPVEDLRPEVYQVVSMTLCPHRYLLESIIDDRIVANNEFLYQNELENTLILQTWRHYAGKPVAELRERIVSLLEGEMKALEKYYFFWPRIELMDIVSRAANYFRYHILIGNYEYLKFDAISEQHMYLRRCYGQGSIFVDISDEEPKNPFPAFEAVAEIEGEKKIYKLHKFKKKQPIPSAYVRDMKSYLKMRVTEKISVPSTWCNYCPYHNVCLESYIRRE